MKKTIIIAAAIIILAGGGFYFFNHEAVAPTVNDIGNEAVAPGGLVVKDSIFSWLKKGKGVECTIDAEEGKITVMALGDKIRMEGLSMLPEKTDAESSTFLSDGNFVYVWNGMEGIKLDMQKMNEISGQAPGSGENQYSWENMAQEWDKAKVTYDCQEKKLSDDLFTVPDDVAFVDWTEMMNNAAEMSGSLQASTTGEEASNTDQTNGAAGNVDTQAIKKMMEDAQNQAPTE